MKTGLTQHFKKSAKKLHKNQIPFLEQADESMDELTLLSFASHENFYENLKKQLH